jgi:outer membrane protein OmpA-like peptidoglycan-associated protein
MKKIIITFCFTFNMLILLSSPSQALLNEDAAIDSRGSFLRDSNGNCVRTQWSVGLDPCAPIITQVVSQNIVQKIMGMEERKIYFAFDRADIEDSERIKLKIIADTLREHNITKVKIVGYTDKIGLEKYNQILSEKRANAVKALLDSSVDLDSSLVDIRGLGKTHQLKDCSEIKEKQKLINCLSPNRRVEIEIDYYDIK